MLHLLLKDKPLFETDTNHTTHVCPEMTKYTGPTCYATAQLYQPGKLKFKAV